LQRRKRNREFGQTERALPPASEIGTLNAVAMSPREMQMKFGSLTLALALIGGAGVALAQGDVVAERQTILKTFGAGVREPGAMIRGEAPFDLAKVQASLATLKAGAAKLPPLFPDASLTATGTKALPIIGQERDKFVAIFTKMGADVTAAEGAIKDEASFKAEFPKVLANCGACHRVYRAPQ
jgi:cytochrome c556